MKFSILLSRGLPALIYSLFLISPSADPRAVKTALDEYVEQPDPAFAFYKVNAVKTKGVTAYMVKLISQEWLTPSEVNRTTWEHWLKIMVPDKVAFDTGLLFIGGGRNDNKVPDSVDERLAGVALKTQSVVAELGQVPNQPLEFENEGRERWEDSLIAYTWDKFLRTGDERWPARLPMTKSAVRAMDAITEFCETESKGSVHVDKFVVAGGSKRGWTTWTTAAVDKRVVAIVPIVIDLLNVVPSFEHHYQAYGFFAPAVGDYEEMGIMDWMDRDEYKALLRIVEPYEYRDRLTMPKLLLNACGDQFFLPDSSQFYFDDLPGEKHLRYVPNTDHSMKDSDAIETLLSFYASILNKAPRPEFSWESPQNGTLVVKTKDKPREVRLWQATNPEARDFRVDTIGQAWKSSVMKADTDGRFAAVVPKPDKGWTAFCIELTYPGIGGVPLKLTTEVQVVPDILPFGKYKPKSINR